MKELFENFLKWNPIQQVRFLKEGEFTQFQKEEKIAFLKEAASRNTISSKVLSCAIKILRELKCRDREFYQSCLNHPDCSVAIAARRALDSCGPKLDTDFFKMREMLKKHTQEKKIETLQQVILIKQDIAEELLISFLGDTDLKVQTMAIKELVQRESLDEDKIAQLLDRSTWNVKAAAIEVLGKRKSEKLLPHIERLIHDANAEVRIKLTQALANLNRDQVKKYLLELSADPHIHVKKEALLILQKI